MFKPGDAVRNTAPEECRRQEERFLAQELGRRERGELEAPADRDRDGGRDTHVPDDEDQPHGEAIRPVNSGLGAIIRLNARDVLTRQVRHSANCRSIKSANMTNRSSHRKVARDFRQLSRHARSA
jgi:hypothetical protein